MAGILDTIIGLFTKGGKATTPAIGATTPAIGENTPDPTLDLASGGGAAGGGGGGVLSSIASIVASVGSVISKNLELQAKQTELEGLKVKYKAESSNLTKQIVLEQIKLKSAEVIGLQKIERQKNLINGAIILAAIGFLGFVLYLVIRPPKAAPTIIRNEIAPVKPTVPEPKKA